MTEPHSQPQIFAGLVDLARADLGGETLDCSDDFFASMEHLLRPEPAVFDPSAYTDRGKLMDGWESRRKRVPGHDWCIIRLGVPGKIFGVDIDTAYFMGNHPPHASIEAISVPPETDLKALRTELEWTEIVPATSLQRGSQNVQVSRAPGPWTHIRIRIYPDGGVARLRVWGEPVPERPIAEEIDLAGLQQGGRAIACSDMFFSPMNNLVLPHAAKDMGGGWETRRSRPPGEDWIVVELGATGRLSEAIIDTRHFKGNFPDTVSLEAIRWPGAPLPGLLQSPDWVEVVPRFETQADQAHRQTITDSGPWTHVRLRIFPDGGVSRLRVMGQADETSTHDPLLMSLNGLSPAEAEAALMRCCGSTRWAQRMAQARPFVSRAHLHGQSSWIWWQLDDSDWLEAFTHHPVIGASPEALRARFAGTAVWSGDEQSGVRQADEETLLALAESNQAYLDRFGYIFIVCATGLTAAEMLHRLRVRLPHKAENEIRIAAGEQEKITRIRLDKLEIP